MVISVQPEISREITRRNTALLTNGYPLIANNIVIRMATGIPRAYTAEQPINVAMERQKNSGVASRTQKNWRKTK
jgi:hypothetical protein